MAFDDTSVSSDIFRATLPKRWGFFQRLKNHLLYVCIRGVFAFFRYIPSRLSELLLLFFGALAPWVMRREVCWADDHLQRAFPEKSKAERRGLIHRSFRHLACSANEAIHMDELLRDRNTCGLTAENGHVLDSLLARQKGLVAVTGHIGNWELLAQVVAAAGYAVGTVARPLYDPRLTRWVHRERTRNGLQLLWRGDAHVSKQMLRMFRRNEILAMLIDQDTKVQGVFSPFFGRPAHTPSAAALLALRMRAPVIVTWHHRTTEGHRFYFEEVDFVPSGNMDVDVQSLTDVLNQKLEQVIRRYPEQWVWFHRRWKTQPLSQ